MCDFEATLQVYLVDLFNSIFNFLYFSILITIPVANIMCQVMVSRNPMPFMCMNSQNMVTFLYLLRMTLGRFDTMIGSACWKLWGDFLPYRCVTLGPYMSSAILTSSRRIGRFCRILLSAACSIRSTGWTVM